MLRHCYSSTQCSDSTTSFMFLYFFKRITLSLLSLARLEGFVDREYRVQAPVWPGSLGKKYSILTTLWSKWQKGAVSNIAHNLTNFGLLFFKKQLPKSLKSRPNSKKIANSGHTECTSLMYTQKVWKKYNVCYNYRYVGGAINDFPAPLHLN